jgi:hypothetical protein
MKLELAEKQFESSENFRSKEFGIKDPDFIMEILGSKMYTNPIKAVVQELCSNARDAHREVGKHDFPIEIVMPTREKLVWEVRDFGPGITPDRMADVFIQFGASTKRDDNTQTGGFGLGAKSFFAYADSAVITSITPENDLPGARLIKREYIAHISKNRKREMSLASSTVTKDPQGTRISIAVKQEDVYKFQDVVKNTFRFWKVKPKLVNWAYDFQEVSKVLDGVDSSGREWFFISDRSSFILVDEIPYPINKDFVKNADGVLSFNPVLCFNTGDIMVAATRDSLDYSNKTIAAVEKFLEEIAKQIKEKCEKEIEDCATYIDALHRHRDLMARFNPYLVPSVWHKKPIYSSISTNGCNAYIYRYTSFSGRCAKDRGDKYSISLANITKNACIAISDGVDTSIKLRVNTLMNQYDTVYVLVDAQSDDKNLKSFADFLKSEPLCYIDTVNLSTIAKTVVKSNSPTTKRNPLAGAYYYEKASHYNVFSGHQTLYDPNTSLSGYYVVKKKDRYEVSLNNREVGISTENLMEICSKFLNGPVYAIIERVEKVLPKIPNWNIKPFGQALQDKLLSTKFSQEAANYKAFSEEYDEGSYFSSNLGIIINKFAPRFTNMIVDPDFINFITEFKKWTDAAKNELILNKAIHMYEHHLSGDMSKTHKPTGDITNAKKLQTRYPFLHIFDLDIADYRDRGGTTQQKQKAIVDYINTIYETTKVAQINLRASTKP